MDNPFELFNERLKQIEALVTEIKLEMSSIADLPKAPVASERLIGDKALADYLVCTNQTIYRIKKKRDYYLSQVWQKVLLQK